MLEIVISGGWVMVPIILCSIVAAAIILERLWTLQPQRVVPRNLSRQVWEWISTNQINASRNCAAVLRWGRFLPPGWRVDSRTVAA